MLEGAGGVNGNIGVGSEARVDCTKLDPAMGGAMVRLDARKRNQTQNSSRVAVDLGCTSIMSPHGRTWRGGVCVSPQDR